MAEVELNALHNEDHLVQDRDQLIERGYGATRFKITPTILKELQANKVILVDCNYGEYVLAITLESQDA